MKRAYPSRVAAWLLAAALLLVTSGALTHELDHDFKRHDGTCALHFFSEHSAGPLPPTALVVAPVAVISEPIPYFPSTLTTSTVAPYGARAPPARSDV